MHLYVIFTILLLTLVILVGISTQFKPSITITVFIPILSNSCRALVHLPLNFSFEYFDSSANTNTQL